MDPICFFLDTFIESLHILHQHGCNLTFQLSTNKTQHWQQGSTKVHWSVQYTAGSGSILAAVLEIPWHIYWKKLRHTLFFFCPAFFLSPINILKNPLFQVSDLFENQISGPKCEQWQACNTTLHDTDSIKGKTSLSPVYRYHSSQNWLYSKKHSEYPTAGIWWG